jgi:N-methylhydantoinase B/oxoprolinase/acetone carboxylase alpha subunit
MVINKIKQLADYQAKVAALQKKIEQERAKALANLHEKYGFESARELIKALRTAAAGGGTRRGRKAGRHRKHAGITAELKEKIKAALQAGKTGGTVAAEFGVSLPSVYNIKKASGLVKARKKK